MRVKEASDPAKSRGDNYGQMTAGRCLAYPDEPTPAASTERPGTMVMIVGLSELGATMVEAWVVMELRGSGDHG